MKNRELDKDEMGKNEMLNDFGIWIWLMTLTSYRILDELFNVLKFPCFHL